MKNFFSSKINWLSLVAIVIAFLTDTEQGQGILALIDPSISTKVLAFLSLFVLIARNISANEPTTTVSYDKLIEAIASSEKKIAKKTTLLSFFAGAFVSCFLVVASFLTIASLGGCRTLTVPTQSQDDVYYQIRVKAPHNLEAFINKERRFATFGPTASRLRGKPGDCIIAGEDGVFVQYTECAVVKE